jgi:molybdate transport repressor ModE-like protein
MPPRPAPVNVHSKVWLERDGQVALSAWRIALLEAVHEAGSLSAGAARLGVPYRTAWYKLRQIEEQLGLRLLDTHSGGPDGGYTTLTPEAIDIIRRFHRASRGFEDLVRERFESEFPELTS